MKMVKAYIKERKLEQVVEALQAIDTLGGISIVAGKGFGRGRANTSNEKVVLGSLSFVEHIQLEVICSNSDASRVLKSIQKEANTGLCGDGKVFIYELENIIRISSNESGDLAI